MKVDLHVHTACSGDSLTTCHDVLYWAKRRAMGALAITDHNTIVGALALQEMSSIPIIVGEEIRTTGGEMIGLFLRREVPAGLSPLQTARAIHEQGGLVYIPHPFDRVRRSVLVPQALSEVLGEVDLIEVLNARVTFIPDNARAEELAQSVQVPRGAGSDAHQGFEIGRAYVEMPAFAGPEGFLASLVRGQVCGQVSSPLVHVGSTYARFAKGLLLAAMAR